MQRPNTRAKALQVSLLRDTGTLDTWTLGHWDTWTLGHWTLGHWDTKKGKRDRERKRERERERLEASEKE